MLYLQIGVLFCCSLWACSTIYNFGVSGSLLLDSANNLISLRSLPSLSFSDAAPFVLGNQSGPLGRPVSMYSFWLDYNGGELPAEAMRATNIAIHLTITAAFALLVSMLLKGYERYSGQAALVAALCGIVWAFHPENISTVQYVVQRMTQLSALFSILSLVSYCYGRKLVISNEIRGLIFLCFAFFPFALLAVFSKENSVLLILVFFILEKTIFQDELRPQRFELFYRVCVLGLLLIIAVGFLASIPGFLENYQYRSFTMLERLMSQFRVLAMQLGYIFLPNISEFTLFHERMPYSTSLFSPLSTLWGFLLHATLLGLAFRYRKVQAVAAFGIFWFYGWHIVESTIVPLELHFEHRNYLPMMGPLVAVLYYLSVVIHSVSNRGIKVVLRLLTVFWVSSFAFLTLQLNSLWAKPAELTYHWYVVNEQSSRTKYQMAYVYSISNEKEMALDVLLEGVSQYPGEITIALEAWNFACEHGLELSYSLEDLADSDELIYEGDSVSHQFQGLRWNAMNRSCEFVSEETFEQLLAKVDALTMNDTVRSSVYFDVSGIYLTFGNVEKAYEYLETAYDLNPKPTVLTQHALLAMFLEDYSGANAILDFALEEEYEFGLDRRVKRTLEQIRRQVEERLADSAQSIDSAPGGSL